MSVQASIWDASEWATGSYYNRIPVNDNAQVSHVLCGCFPMSLFLLRMSHFLQQFQLVKSDAAVFSVTLQPFTATFKSFSYVPFA